MHILIGIGAAVALLYFWLLGSQFARILAFLVFGTGFGFVLSVVMPHAQGAVANGEVGFPLGFLLAWFVAGIPNYIVRRQMARPQIIARRSY